MNNLKKNKQGYGYKYTDLSAIHEYLESIGYTYTQYIKRIDGDDYIFTRKYKDGELVEEMCGCRVVQATLSGKSNPAQEQGSALTYARRYSLLLAFGLATEDDDGESLTKNKINKTMEKSIREEILKANIPTEQVIFTLQKYNVRTLGDLATEDVLDFRKELNLGGNE